MARKSKDNVIQFPARQPAPAYLSASEAELWRAVVNSKPTGWPDAGIAPLLVMYIRAASTCTALHALTKEAFKGEDRRALYRLLAQHDRESRRLAMLATKLHLIPQA